MIAQVPVSATAAGGEEQDHHGVPAAGTNRVYEMTTEETDGNYQEEDLKRNGKKNSLEKNDRQMPNRVCASGL